MDKLLPLSFTFLVFIFMVFKLWMRSKIKEAPKTLPPAPWKLPIIGHLHLLIFVLPHQRLVELAKRHGSVMHLQLGELSHVVVFSSEAAQEVMKTHNINFANRPFLIGAEIVLYNLSDIAFAPYGSCWRQLRKVCTLELLSVKRVQSFRSVREECKKHEAFISFLKKFMEAMAGFNIADKFPSIKFLPDLSGMRSKLERFHHDIDTMLESIIQEHRDSSANSV
ncbi:hypothetical protein ES332_D01G097800v1 [Gossypium tomentosum]|uniref:Cytochrome P450 n=1 Tax=Gossypium tomentosum TaxID=34277 RepID=A0A5D2M738_GOSTO|nr:hypothetical protein ES332_D01G097800v1 [Gossypium tomentosum]